ncbi:class I SAM-dependent methyltransferase [Chitinivorax sp. PXF-14]|uniref:class I SAM-dependent methyltransferase n=1 Tax=Chitinivorax sp. PXF-14 TaxID=3230488 RepID=UPI00346743DD
MSSEAATRPTYQCKICGYQTQSPAASECGQARGNTERFRQQQFNLWQCPKCQSIHNVDPVDFQDIYTNYPLNMRRLDVFAKGTLANLLKRLQFAGLRKDARILDMGCGNGLMLEYLREQGYGDVHGYDPYVQGYATPPTGQQFDCVIANDVIEHVPDPRQFAKDCAGLVKPGGLLYIGTADVEGVDMSNLSSELMRLHQPFHRVLFNQQSLEKIGRDTGLALLKSYRRSYMDTLKPFSNYRFLDEFSKALGHVVDRSLAPDAGKVILKKPSLLFYAFFGYFLPCAYEPAIVLKKAPGQGL